MTDPLVSLSLVDAKTALSAITLPAGQASEVYAQLAALIAFGERGIGDSRVYLIEPQADALADLVTAEVDSNARDAASKILLT